MRQAIVDMARDEAQDWEALVTIPFARKFELHNEVKTIIADHPAISCESVQRVHSSATSFRRGFLSGEMSPSDIRVAGCFQDPPEDGQFPIQLGYR